MFHPILDAASGVLAITLDKPPANAIGEDDIDVLSRLLSEAAGDERTRVLLFQASGRFFCAGADIKLMAGLPPGAMRSERLTALAARLQAVYEQIERLPLPSVAALNGVTTGGGLELALACDLRIAATSARIGLPETRIGLLPGAGGTQRLTRIAGRAVALEAILSGTIYSAGEAARRGIVHEIVADTELAQRARALAVQLASQPRAALAAAKRCIGLAESRAGYLAEIAETRRLHDDPDTLARIAAFAARG